MKYTEKEIEKTKGEVEELITRTIEAEESESGEFVTYEEDKLTLYHTRDILEQYLYSNKTKEEKLMEILDYIDTLDIKDYDLEKCNANKVVYALEKIGQLHNRFMSK
jgi:hypothetical protein